MIVKTLEELLEVLPERVRLSRSMRHNLATMNLALEGKVEITGVVDGRLTSVNTAKGRQEIVERLIEKIEE